MENKTLTQLEQEAKALGIVLNDTENREQLINLISDKKAELDKPIIDDAEVTRIKEEGKINAAKLKRSQQASIDEKKYSEADLKALYKSWKEDEIKETEVDEDAPIVHKLTIPRFDNKFIVGFANLNKDPFFPNKVITSQSIWDDKTKVFIPNVTCIYEDGTELTVPFETILKVSNKVTCKIIERKQKDASVKFGTIHVQEVKGDTYNMVDTGETIQGKMKRFVETFLVETPNGDQLWVSPDVINWKPSPEA